MTFTANSSGGEYKHKLTISEMPSHKHQLKADSISGGSTYGVRDGTVAQSQFRTLSYMNTEGGDGAHNNMSPWKGVYRWCRIA